MDGRDHSCEQCGRVGFNDPDGRCECQLAPGVVYRVELDGLVNPAAIHFGPEVGDMERVARGWRDTGARVTKYTIYPIGLDKLREERSQALSKLAELEDLRNELRAKAADWHWHGYYRATWGRTADLIDDILLDRGSSR